LVCLIYQIFSQQPSNAPSNAPAPAPAPGPTPTSPPSTICNSVGGYNLQSIALATDYTYPWNPKAADQKIVFNICGNIHTTCGSTPDDECSSTATNCCGVCQEWQDDDGAQGACLGKFASVQMDGSMVRIVYTGGDPVNSVGRTAYIQISCGSGAAIPTQFVQAQSHLPNQPYIYLLNINSSLLCGGLGGGGWFLIILFCVVLPFYLIGGLVYNKFVAQKENGPELIPNYEFWIETPSYFLAGLTFTKDKFMSLIGRGENYSNIQ